MNIMDLKFFDSEGFKITRSLEKKIENIIFDKSKYNKIINLSYESGKAIKIRRCSRQIFRIS